MRKCEKDGFWFLFFKACLVYQGGERRRVLLSASHQDVWTTARIAVLGVPSNRDARAGRNGISNQQAGLVGIAVGRNGSWVPS